MYLLLFKGDQEVVLLYVVFYLRNLFQLISLILFQVIFAPISVPISAPVSVPAPVLASTSASVPVDLGPASAPAPAPTPAPTPAPPEPDLIRDPSPVCILFYSKGRILADYYIQYLATFV